MSEAQAYAIVSAMLREEEKLALTAYPDPKSPLGRALVKLHGPNACLMVGQGKLLIPPALLATHSGNPWTIGYGQTGPDIKHGMVWSRQHAEDRLRESVRAFDQAACAAWPGADRLHHKARAALISLAYNRGTSMVDSKKNPGDRREMRELRPAVALRDYNKMAELIESMKRIWEGKGLGGLLKRRAREAALCRQAANEVAKA